MNYLHPEDLPLDDEDFAQARHNLAAAISNLTSAIVGFENAGLENTAHLRLANKSLVEALTTVDTDEHGQCTPDTISTIKHAEI